MERVSRKNSFELSSTSKLIIDANARKACLQNFLQLLADGDCVAFEDACMSIETSEAYDRRALGTIVSDLKKSGLIVRAGYRPSRRRSHHSATKTLWCIRRESID